MNTTIVLETERLQLMMLDEAWASELLAYQLRNREPWQAWNPLTADEFYTLEVQRARLYDDTMLWQQGRGLRLYMLRRDALEGPLIGDVGFNNIVRGAFQSCHLGYKLDAAAQGKGYMTEALRRAISYVFDVLLLHRIEANVMPHNVRSRRVVERLGFSAEGLAHNYLKINGAWEDHIHYVIFNDAV